jgi:hypothetical protein
MSNLLSHRLRAAAVLCIFAAVALATFARLGSAASSNSNRVHATSASKAAAVSAITAPPTTAAPTTTTATTAPPTTVATTTTAASPPPPPPAPVVPTGKGMWIWQPDQADGGDPNAIVARAKATGLTHLYVRTGSSIDGFNAAEFLDVLLPVAHANGIRVIGWDFPYFDDVEGDVVRALAAINYTTPSGDRIDGFSPDVETPSEGVALSADAVYLYASALRSNLGPSYLLIATVPRPSSYRIEDYPYGTLLQYMDAVAPMVYWIDQPPDQEAAEAVDYLSQFGKPVLPVGQAYDGALEGGPPGTPTGDEIDAFINAAQAHGAAGVSFWSWQHASDEMWNAIAAAQEVGQK